MYGLSMSDRISGVVNGGPESFGWCNVSMPDVTVPIEGHET